MDQQRAAWFYGAMAFEDACAVLQYEADGCFLVRTHPAASPRGDRDQPSEVCELIYMHQGRPHSRDVDVTKRGVRFRGGHSYFENLSVLVLSYTASPGEELLCALTHPPGQALSANDDMELSTLDAFAFDAHAKQQRRRSRKVGVREWRKGEREGGLGHTLILFFFFSAPQSEASAEPPIFTDFLHQVEQEVPQLSWFKSSPVDVRVGCGCSRVCPPAHPTPLPPSPPRWRCSSAWMAPSLCGTGPGWASTC